jgi:hypothetical protein
MKLIYAKLWLKKYIKYNHANLDESKLNRSIINLSHRVYKSHGQRGHNVRQSIRATLVEYSKAELAKYNVAFNRPLKTSFTHRRARLLDYWIIRTIFRTLVFVIKIIGLLVLLYILYVILHFL